MSTQAQKKVKKFDVEYFIDKFTKIPNSKWTTGQLTDGDRCCVLGHCGVKLKPAPFDESYKYSPESRALEKILRAELDNCVFVGSAECELAVAINDGDADESPKLGKTPRTRILNALRRAQKSLQKKGK